MTPRELKARLAAGGRVYGTAVLAPSPRWPEAVAKTGVDFVFLDSEHTPIDRAMLSWLCHSYRGYGLAPIVRIPSPDPYQACMVLDGGAGGVIAPYVETAAQARELAGAVKFRPLKGRRLADALAGRKSLEPELDSYLHAANRDNLLVLNIESRPAIEALDEILAVAGIDVLLIGPHDLSCSLGHPEAYDHPDFDRAVKTIFAKARAKGVGAGIHSWMGVEREADWARAGANFLVHDTDVRIFTTALRHDLQRLRQVLGDEESRPTGEAAPV